VLTLPAFFPNHERGYFIDDLRHTTTTTATTTSASIIVGFVYGDRYEFAPVMSCCHFDPADIPDCKRLSILSVFLVVLQRTTSLAILITFFSRGFQKNNVPTTVQVISLNSTMIYNDSTTTMMK